MKKAIVQGSKIIQIAEIEFPVHSGYQWVEVPDDTTVRDTFVNGEVEKEKIDEGFLY